MSSSGNPSNFVDHCRDLARLRPHEVAYTWLRDGEVEELSLSFSELDAHARKIAASLEARGLGGSRALLCYAPGLEFIAAFLGCLYARVAAVPLNAPQTEQAAAALFGIARHAEPSILLSDSVLASTGLFGPGLLGQLECLVTDELPLAAGMGWRPGPISPDGLAFIQYTSGSTGTPKGVEVSHRNLIRNEEMIRAGFGHDANTIFVGWLPLFHDMGLVGNVLQPLFLGIRSILMAPSAFIQRPVRWLEAITRYRGTTAGGPNFGYDQCVRRVSDDQLAGLDLSSWTVAYNGAEPVRAQTLERFVEKFAPAGFRRETFYPCYGLAEAALFVTGGTQAEPFAVLDVATEALSHDRIQLAPASERGTLRLVSCGRPWLDGRVLVVDPKTSLPTGVDVVGEIWIQGGNVAQGYRNLPPGTNDPFRAHLATGEGPFFRTGDLGFVRDGELYVTGRLKDILIQNGQNFYPHDIELCSGTSHPHLRVDFTAAFTVDVEDAERLVVVQEVHRRHCESLEQGSTESDELHSELIGAVRRAITSRYGVHAWRVVLIQHGGVPKTSSGKVRRRECRALWSRGALPELGATSHATLTK